MSRKIIFQQSLLILLTIIAVNFAFAQEGEGRDPFVSLGDKILAAQSLGGTLLLPYPIVLKGTLYSKNNLVAIINDDIIRQGQRWKDFYVVKIERAKVTLEWRGKEFEVFLSPAEEKEEKKQ